MRKPHYLFCLRHAGSHESGQAQLATLPSLIRGFKELGRLYLMKLGFHAQGPWATYHTLLFDNPLVLPE